MTSATPLSGQRILVTRPAERSASARRAFEGAGATVEAIPTIRIDAPDDVGPLARAVEKLDSYDWVVLSSAAGVERLAAELERRDGGLEALRRARTAAIGPATAAALRERGVPAPLTPDTYVGEALARAILAASPSGGLRALVAGAQDARPELPAGLRAAGVEVDEVASYATHVNWSARATLLEAVESGRLDWLTFTAASTVRSFVALAGAQTAGARVAAIGPVTAAAVGEEGLPLHAVATASTSAGLVEAVAGAVRREAGSGVEA